MAKFGKYTFDPSQECNNAHLFQRVERQLRLDTWNSNSEDSGYVPLPLIYKLTSKYSFEDSMHHFLSEDQKNEQLEAFCRKLYNETILAEGHFSRIDLVFSQILQCQFFEYGSPAKLVAEACHLLARLPATPLNLPDVHSNFDPAYARSDFANEGEPQAMGWEDLQVVLSVTTSVIRVALLIAIYGSTSSATLLRSFIDSIADLLSTASRLSVSADSDDVKSYWFLVRAFLWSTWQRCNMLHFYSLVGGHINMGFDDHNGRNLILKGFYPAAGLSIQEMSKRFASATKPAYMCGWAFELIRTDPCAIGLDFRNFFERFSSVFGDREGRCVPDQQASCKGDEAGSCQRFKGMKIENQSLHHGDCQGNCGRLIWNRESYISVPRARAVRLEDCGPRDNLTYCEASNQTLAISHVWSHGQGGRSEAGHGLNCCLHQRYVSIAKTLGCDSYWMDTPCIPEDHKLRREAIFKINEIFEHSKATLVCDRDLMSISATDLSVRTRETILVTAMTCDWNLRAWTFLEAFRGRHNVYILRRDSAIVSLKETVEMVYRQGNLDIATLLLTIPHLLPPRSGREVKSAAGAIVPGFMSLETSGSLLSHREASRPGDDIVIWSLLMGDKVHYSSKTFWKNQIDQVVSCSFLFSSAPRLKKRGFRWAPSSPSAQLLADRANGDKYRLMAYDGYDSSAGLITRDGLRATWLMYDFAGGMKGSTILSNKMKIDMQPVEQGCRNNLNRIRKIHLRGRLWGALLRPIAAQTYNDPVVHRGDANRTLVAVCATNKRFLWPGQKDKRIFWRWCGVYEWDMVEPLPKFETIKNVYIV